MMGALPSYAVQGWVQSQAQTREVLRSYTGHPLVQYSTVQYSIVLYSTAKHNTVHKFQLRILHTLLSLVYSSALVHTYTL